MGNLIDTNVLIKWERQRELNGLASLREYFPFYISAVTVGELYIGVHRAVSAERRSSR